MKVGFIGTGSMGSILIEAFIRSGALLPEEIVVSNRTFAKAELLASRYPGMCAVSTNCEAAAERDIVFLCIKPLEFKSVIDEIKASLQPEQVIVSITSPVLLAHLEDWLPCKTAKIIPSITNMTLSGASLCMYGTRISSKDRENLEGMFSKISVPIEIEERYTRVVSDISSCGPAFMACLLELFIHAAVDETGIDYAEAELLACSMLLGTGRLLTEGALTPEALQTRVSVPGGITAEALKLLRLELEGTFNRLIRTTHAKYNEDLEKVQRSFSVNR
jgi:competence protein ComER